VILGRVKVVVTEACDEEMGVLVIGEEDEEEAGDEAIDAGMKKFSFEGSDTIKYFKRKRRRTICTGNFSCI
jgi:hypothetical protein